MLLIVKNLPSGIEMPEVQYFTKKTLASTLPNLV